MTNSVMKLDGRPTWRPATHQDRDGRGEHIAELNGHRESIRCGAEYAEAKDGSALNQAIVCASESFKLNIKSYVEATGESV